MFAKADIVQETSKLKLLFKIKQKVESFAKTTVADDGCKLLIINNLTDKI